MVLSHTGIYSWAARAPAVLCTNNTPASPRWPMRSLPLTGTSPPTKTALAFVLSAFESLFHTFSDRGEARDYGTDSGGELRDILGPAEIWEAEGDAKNQPRNAGIKHATPQIDLYFRFGFHGCWWMPGSDKALFRADHPVQILSASAIGLIADDVWTELFSLPIWSPSLVSK